MAPPGRPPMLHNIFNTPKKKQLPKGISLSASKAVSKSLHAKSNHAFTSGGKAKGSKKANAGVARKESHIETLPNIKPLKTTSKKNTKESKQKEKSLLTDTSKAIKLKNAKTATKSSQALSTKKAEKAPISSKESKISKKNASPTNVLAKIKKATNREHSVVNLHTASENPTKKQPSSDSRNKQSHLDDATSKDHYSQYGSIPSGFKYFKNVVRDLQPVAQQLRAASQKLTENSQYAHCIMERQEHMIADYIRQRARHSKKDKQNVRRNLDKFSDELERVYNEDNRTCRESYNYVDVKIQKMDADLRAKRSIYEELAKESRLEVPNDLSVLNIKKSHKRKKNSMHANKKPLLNQTLMPKTALSALPVSDAGVNMTGVGASLIAGGSDTQPANRLDPAMVKDMPIDPHEPLYCYCKQVSFGDMIACDNPECQTEWYHFACVGITRKPPGKWFCPTCLQQQTQQPDGGDSATLK